MLRAVSGIAHWSAPALLCIIAIVRAATAQSPALLSPATEEERRAMYEAVLGEETSMRRTAAKDFPTEAWSADDDFHSLEQQRALLYARQHRFRYEDVLSAMDVGMRSGWTLKGGTAPRVNVPPCRPRAIY
jgi:hypothetical protein